MSPTDVQHHPWATTGLLVSIISTLIPPFSLGWGLWSHSCDMSWQIEKKKSIIETPNLRLSFLLLYMEHQSPQSSADGSSCISHLVSPFLSSSYSNCPTLTHCCAAALNFVKLILVVMYWHCFSLPLCTPRCCCHFILLLFVLLTFIFCPFEVSGSGVGFLTRTLNCGSIIGPESPGQHKATC